MKKVTDDKTHACISMLIRLHFCDKIDFLDWEIKLFRLIILCWEVNLNTWMWWEVITQQICDEYSENAAKFIHIDYAFSWISVTIWLLLQQICFTSSTLASNQDVVSVYCSCMCFVTPIPVIIHITVNLHVYFVTGNIQLFNSLD